ncbi:FAD-dependent monooxygenase [Mycobacterium paraintracellulare]|uniref:FAD-dependent monooxygenase n=1 Tax=Mycobacterium paraintracellulare TaxID=1138383 RepID=UPI0019294F7D|nr:FAD-dependent monooxygenase [Mycobacterium paraintracellulare]BCP14208.1 hypothetical protein MINTM021_11170 [Mycobacterium paraintracellulare]
MAAQHVDVLGAGPGGLFAARLIKQGRPDWDVVVHERDEIGETFGFGYGLTPATLRNLGAADRAFVEDIRGESAFGHGHILHGVDGIAQLHGARNIAIGRKVLLEILARHALDCGVEIRRGARVDLSDLQGDVVVAADGARSAVREKLASEVGATVRTGTDLLMWCGVDFAVDNAFFLPVHTEHGLFVAHGYPYARDRSTLVIESDPETLRRANLLQEREASLNGQADLISLRYLAGVFEDLLQGRQLLGNRSSRWSHFSTVHCQRWHHGNVVLIGDAAHTAHPSIGSGTKLAMEDAIALARCLCDHDDLERAYNEYERRRRPNATRLQRLARYSELWWESYPRRESLPVANVAVSFMSRAGKISFFDFLASETTTAQCALSTYAGCPVPSALDRKDLESWILGRPLALKSMVFHSRAVSDAEFAACGFCESGSPASGTASARSVGLTWSRDEVWGAAGDQVVESIADPIARGIELIWVTGPADHDAVLSRLNLAERLRLHSGVAVGVDVPKTCRDDAVTSLVAQRCDLVRFIEGSPGEAGR